MVFRSRDRRGRGNRPVGVIRRGRASRVQESRPDPQHSSRDQGIIYWRLFSGFIVISLTILLFLFFSADSFYVRSVAVGGLQYLTKEEVFAFSDVANVHVFWLDPEETRENILRSASIAEAKVVLGWPPNIVQIVIEEREPALVWENAGVATWIDLQGRAMTLRADRDDLIRIIAADIFEGPLDQNDRVSVDIVHGAIQLQDLFPEVTTLRFDPAKGLGYKNENGWDIWFGTGTGMAEKVAIYNTLTANLIARGIQPGEINIANPDAPVYTVLWGR